MTTEEVFVSSVNVGDKVKTTDGLWHRVVVKTSDKHKVVLVIAYVGTFTFSADDCIEVHRCL